MEGYIFRYHIEHTILWFETKIEGMNGNGFRMNNS